MRSICADLRLVDSLVTGSNLRHPSPKYRTAIGMSLFNIAQFSTGLLAKPLQGMGVLTNANENCFPTKKVLAVPCDTE
jgi:hypothetical protein